MTDETQLDETLDVPTDEGLPEIDLADFSIADDEAITSLRGADTAPRFDGDTSQLPNSVCYALQELIAAPHVSSKSKNWAVIEAEETLLRSRLSELNLLLEINRETKHAFTRQVSENDPRQRNLLRAQSLSLAASVLALFLRLKHLSSPDETAVVERQEMLDHLLTFRPARDTDEAGFVKKADAAINQLETRRLIRRVGTSDRYAVHSVIASLLTPEQVDLYTAAYRDLASTDQDLGEAAAPVDDGEAGTVDLDSAPEHETQEQQ